MYALLFILAVGSASSVFGQQSSQKHHGSANTTTHGHSASYKCSKEEMQFQWDNIGLVAPHICEPVHMMTPWQLVQMIYPNLDVFIDVGANRGYTAAEFFGLWSPGHGFNRINLHNALKDDKEKGLLQNTDQINTFCNDGIKEDEPLICVGRFIKPCLSRRSIRVFSFDGQRTHWNESTSIVRRRFPQISPNYTVDPNISNVKATWEYIHAAMTDHVEPNEKYGYFLVSTHEGGKLIKSQKDAKPGTDFVRLYSVDSFCEERKLNHVSVLKIDAEGHDIEVLNGAKQTLLHRGVKVINYEGWNLMGDEWAKTFKELDTVFGFDCYQIGQYNLVARVTNCWDNSHREKIRECTKESNPKCPEFIQWFEPKQRLDGNGICVHRKRGASLHSMFEQMSLYTFYNNAKGHFHKDALLSNQKARFDELGKIVMSEQEIGEWNRRTGRNYMTGVEEWMKRR